MNADLTKYSVEDRRRIAKRARRNINSECTLILTGGFATLMVVTFFLGKYTFLPISEVLNIRPTIVWVIMSVGVSTCWSLLHHLYFRAKILRASALNSAFLYEYQSKIQLERDAKIQNIQNIK